MKKSEIEKVDGGYEVILHLEELSPHGFPTVQEFTENSLDKVFEFLRDFYGEDKKKGDK